MSLKWRIATALGVLAGLAVALACLAAYLSTDGQLREGLDRSLSASVSEIAAGPGADLEGGDDDDSRTGEDVDGCPPAPLFSPAAAAQLVSDDGLVTRCIPSGPRLPLPPTDLADGAVDIVSVSIDGEPFRVASTSFHEGGTLQIAQTESANTEVLAALRTQLALITLFVAAGAAIIGWLVARQLVGPVVSLRDATRRMAHDHDLARPVPVTGGGETRDLAVSFNAMVDALSTSREQQRRLVADASHEMRTPLTSLTANLDLLEQYERLPEADRPEVLGAVRADVEDLTELMVELVDLAADRSRDEPVVDVDLADIAEAVAARARRRTGRTITVRVNATGTVPGRVSMLERALNNLVDNAHKYSPAGTTIELVTEVNTVSVIDHGDGIPPAERDVVFDRFWRASTARSRPGTGLGLAIVQQIIDRHGGTVVVDDTPGGGSTFTIVLPGG